MSKLHIYPKEGRIMNRKTVSGIMLILILISALTLAFSIQPVKGQPKTWTVDDDGPADFHTIQEAINAANPGDTIYARVGTYYENLVVNKSLALLGENKNTTVIVGVVHSPAWESAISVRADDVRIANLTVTNGGHGIYLGARRSIVTDCVAYGNGFGLTISSSQNNFLRRNLLFNNSYNLHILGFWSISDFIQDIDSSNHVNGKPVYYLVNEENLSISPATFPNVGYLGVVNSSNVQIANLSLSRNGDGLLVAFSPNTVIENVEATHNLEGISLKSSPETTIKDCNFSFNQCGIHLYYSDNVKIKENSISHNDGGIFLLWSNHNLIHHNNLIENYQYYQARIENSYHCDWDAGYPSGGNYWSDYAGNDTYSGPYQNESGYDWIGDYAYVIDENNQDDYPLMKPYAPETEEVRITYRKLLGKYNELLADYDKLNSTYYTLSSNYTELQGDYDALNSSYNDLNATYNELKSEQRATKNELSYIRNLLYVFIATTIILIATTVYFAIRKPKIITQTQ